MSSTPRLDKETMPREKTGSKEEKRGEEKRRERGGEEGDLRLSPPIFKTLEPPIGVARGCRGCNCTPQPNVVKKISAKF